MIGQRVGDIDWPLDTALVVILREGRVLRPDPEGTLELNDELYAHLREAFPEAHVVHGNASELKNLAERDGYLRDGLADAAISGLGLLSMARATQKAILESTFSVLKPTGRLIQFTYGPSSPVPRELLAELGLQVRRGGFAWWNVPPASVYVYTRNRSEAIHAQRTHA